MHLLPQMTVLMTDKTRMKFPPFALGLHGYLHIFITHTGNAELDGEK